MNKQPFTINIPQPVLDDLRGRLANTRWPAEVEDVGWDYGTNYAYMRELAYYWQHKYDWRKHEAELNSFNWFEAKVDGKTIRYIHERGHGPNPTPIILLHGWPDSVLRYTKLIPMLTNPGRFGGNPDQSFDVIVPDMIEPTANGKVQVREHLFQQFAERYWKLMTEELGYDRFAAGGGDGGSPIAQLMAVHHPESIIGLHLTDTGFSATMAEYPDLSETEQNYLGDLQMASFQENAYAMLQGTKPQTLSFGLNDSPVGLAAWIIEKFHTWSDCDGDVETIYTKDELLTNIMVYWFTGFDPRGYREEWLSPSLQPGQQIHVPVAVAQPPRDVNPVMPRAFAERSLKDIRRWTVLERGGHFVAMEFPELMAEDIRAFFQEMKEKA